MYFSIIMLEPLTTSCKNLSVPSTPPFLPSHVRISNSESINFLTMQPLTLMPKFDIMQAKFTYGFTQTPLISINPKLSLAMVVSSVFWKNPNYQSIQIILHQNSMHQFYSTEKSLTLSCLPFKNLKLAQVSSTANIM